MTSLSQEVRGRMEDLLEWLATSKNIRSSDEVAQKINEIVGLIETSLVHNGFPSNCPQHDCPLTHSTYSPGQETNKESDLDCGHLCGFDEKAIREVRIRAAQLVNYVLRRAIDKFGDQRDMSLEEQADLLVRDEIENGMYRYTSEQKNSAPRVAFRGDGGTEYSRALDSYSNPQTTHYSSTDDTEETEGLLESLGNNLNDEETNLAFFLRRSVRDVIPMFLSPQRSAAAVMTIFDKMNANKQSKTSLCVGHDERTTQLNENHKEHYVDTARLRPRQEGTQTTERFTKDGENEYDHEVGSSGENIAMIDKNDGNDRETNCMYSHRRDIRLMLPKFTGTRRGTSALMTVFDKFRRESDRMDENLIVHNGSVSTTEICQGEVSVRSGGASALGGLRMEEDDDLDQNFGGRDKSMKEVSFEDDNETQHSYATHHDATSILTEEQKNSMKTDSSSQSKRTNFMYSIRREVRQIIPKFLDSKKKSSALSSMIHNTYDSIHFDDEGIDVASQGLGNVILNDEDKNINFSNSIGGDVLNNRCKQTTSTKRKSGVNDSGKAVWGAGQSASATKEK